MKLATLCYVKQNGKTLMLYRNKNPQDVHLGKWNGLGGKFQQGESPEECVIREIEEEAGLQIQNPQLKGILTFPKFTPNHDWIVFVYIANRFKSQGSSDRLKECEEGELAWIADDQLTALPLWEGDRIFFPWLKQNRFFSGKFIYENGKLKSHEVVFY